MGAGYVGLLVFWYQVCHGFFFFFSSRRRHTRCSRDWSSDVCSSDLLPPACTGPKYGSWKSGWLLPDRLTPSRPIEPSRQMSAWMPPRELANRPVAAADSFVRVGLVSRSSSVGWFVLMMSKLQPPAHTPRGSRPAVVAKRLVRMGRTPPGWGRRTDHGHETLRDHGRPAHPAGVGRRLQL